METYDSRSEEPQVAGYDINRQLDVGENSSVWVIVDPKTGDELVLKILGYDASLRELCIRGQELRHEFLVDEVELVQTTQGVGLVMEYCPAGSIAALIASRGPMKMGEVLTVIAPLGEALAFLHQRGITHGDVSPRNILFTATGKPKLGDFGTQTLRGQRPTDYGTSGFCAPEVSSQSNSEDLEPARDVYALAACTWYLLTGRAPALTQNRIPLGAMVPDINDEFALLLEDALSIEPALRPSAAEFTQRIFAGGTPTAVELGDVVEPEALKHMVTTRQVEPHGFGATLRKIRSRRGASKATNRAKKMSQRSGNRTHADLDEQRVFESNDEWALTHKIHAAKGSGKKIVIALGLGALLVITGGYAAQKMDAGNAMVITDAVVPGGKAQAGESERDVKLRSHTDQEVLLAAAQLTRERDKALMSGKSAALRQIYYPGSLAKERDLEVLRIMKNKNLKLGSLKTVLGEARVIASSATNSLMVEAISLQGEYDYQDNSGRVVLRTSKTTRQRVLIELRQDEGNWKIWNVSTAEEAAT